MRYIYIKLYGKVFSKKKDQKTIFFCGCDEKDFHSDFSRKILLFSLFTPPVTNRSKGVHARNK